MEILPDTTYLIHVTCMHGFIVPIFTKNFVSIGTSVPEKSMCHSHTDGESDKMEEDGSRRFWGVSKRARDIDIPRPPHLLKKYDHRRYSKTKELAHLGETCQFFNLHQCQIPKRENKKNKLNTKAKGEIPEIIQPRFIESSIVTKVT